MAKLENIPKEKLMMQVSYRRNHKNFDDIYEKYKDLLPYIKINKLQHQFFLKIEDSIKYKTLVDNDFSLYNNIINKLEPNHTEKKYKKLIKNFSLEHLKIHRNKIVLKYDAELDMYYPHNGNHRLALYFFNNPDKTYLESEYFKLL